MEKVRRVIDQRFACFGLKINAEKTRLVRFKRPPYQGLNDDPDGRPGTFDFPGFTLYWGASSGVSCRTGRRLPRPRFFHAGKFSIGMNYLLT